MSAQDADQLDVLRDSRNNEYMTQTRWFEGLYAEELHALERKLASANTAIVREHGNDSDLNVELCDIYDELADYMTDVHGFVLN